MGNGKWEMEIRHPTSSGLELKRVHTYSILVTAEQKKPPKKSRKKKRKSLDWKGRKCNSRSDSIYLRILYSIYLSNAPTDNLVKKPIGM